MQQKSKFHLLLSDRMPNPVDAILDSSEEDIEVRRARLIGDLAIECIHTHAFLNGLNIKTGMDARFDKIKDFVLNRYIKRTVQLHHDLGLKSTITPTVKSSLEELKQDCERPEFKDLLARLFLNSATKYEDLLNANIVYSGTGERIKFVNYVHSKGTGLSTIITQDVMGENDDDVLHGKVINLCERWIDALYGDMKTHKVQQPKKSVSLPGWVTELSGRNWLVAVRDTIGNTLIALGNFIKANKTDTTNDQTESGMVSEIEIHS